MTFAQRRIRGICWTLGLLAVVSLWVRTAEHQLRDTSFVSGYLLLAAIAFLTLYNLRKKLPQLPLGSSTAWLQLHIYIGLATLGLVALHVGPRIPTGRLDWALLCVYLTTAVSGLIGLYLTRTIPKQLARVGEEFIYERIPQLRRRVADEAQTLVVEAAGATAATTLADFYIERLFEYFGRPRGWRYLVRPTSRLRRTLLSELHALRRFLTEGERTRCERLFALVRKKDDLDFHAARQGLLKLWVFVHLGLTYALVVLSLVHAWAAHAYWGGRF
jgi:hypothetical protein